MRDLQELKGVDKKIYDYLNPDNPKSFLLLAGAGSGKTRTLVNVLQAIRNNNIQRFIKSGQRTAVITYTNAACNEIQHRLCYDPIFAVSTIHSFVWSLIKPFTQDIKEWLSHELHNDIENLTNKLNRAKDQKGKIARQNAKKRESKQKKLNQLSEIKKFTYSPASTTMESGALIHAEVIKIAAHFLTNSPLFRQLLVNKFPILFIDESQDTSKELLDALIYTQGLNSQVFSLGLFGDLMQRIYSGGKHDLGNPLPKGWKRLEKKRNFRCPKRIVRLINSIRKEGDKHEQKPQKNAKEGLVRFFIVDSSCAKKSATEVAIRKRMAKLTDDALWVKNDSVKVLTLEHTMAASRGGFDQFFTPLSKVDTLRDSVLNGTSEVFKFLNGPVLALLEVVASGDNFGIARIVKKYAGLICSNRSKPFLTNPLAVLQQIDKSVEKLTSLMNNNNPSIQDILGFIDEQKLLILPDTLSSLLAHSQRDDNNEGNHATLAWKQALQAPLSHLKNYSLYIDEKLGYGTHQGIKGLEFERVMAIIDDKDANGFLFSYEKLFGAKPLSDKDLDNEAKGADSVLSRTRRLFYVICSRTEKSLAIVAYTKNPLAVKKKSIETGWFNEEEIALFSIPS